MFEVVTAEQPVPVNKYSVRPPKDLRSKYELKMEERRQQQLADEEAELRAAEQERLRVYTSMTWNNVEDHLSCLNPSLTLYSEKQLHISATICFHVNHKAYVI